LLLRDHYIVLPYAGPFLTVKRVAGVKKNRMNFHNLGLRRKCGLIAASPNLTDRAVNSPIVAVNLPIDGQLANCGDYRTPYI
jgi:hypothetical protein